MKKIIQTSFHYINTNNASSGLGENAILTNFAAKILAGKYGTKICKRGWGGTKGNIPGMDMLTAGEEIVPKLDVGCEVGS